MTPLTNIGYLRKSKIKKFMVTTSKCPLPVKIFNETGYGQDSQPIITFSTTCCSLLIASIKDYHSLKETKDTIDYIKKESNSKNFNPQERGSGERNIMVICSPGEHNLEKNLKKLSFKLVSDSLKRRQGYPKPDKLKMYLLTF